MFACSVLLISTESTRSDASVSSLICRTPLSGDGTFTPSIVMLLRRGSVPRICTYLPSPSSRSSVTLGSRPTASAMFAFGRLVITSDDNTCTMLSAVRCAVDVLGLASGTARRSPGSPRSAWRLENRIHRVAAPAATSTVFVNGVKPR